MFLSCKTKSSNPLNGLSGEKGFGRKHIGAIVTVSKHAKIPPKVRVKGFRATDNVETCALDFGACEAVLAPKAFNNTRTEKGSCTGMKYQVRGVGESHQSGGKTRSFC